MMRRIWPTSAATLLLTGCAGTIPQGDQPPPPPAHGQSRPGSGHGSIPGSRPRPAPIPPRSNQPIVVTPVYGVTPGNGPAAYLGQTAADLTRLFGDPALDVQEGTGRKLQFRGGQCVLDAFLYPNAPGQPGVVVQMDARDTLGRDVDSGLCAAGLTRR